MDEDREILSYAQELYRQILPSRPEPDSVSWNDSLSDDRVVVLYGDVTLPLRMKGRLSADEWRPLIASGIFYSRHFRARLRRSMLTHMVLPAVVGEIVLVYVLLQVLPNRIVESSGGLFLALVALTIFLALLSVLGVYWVFRTLQYEADKRVGAIAGAQSIIQSLQRIQEVTSTLPGPKRGYGLLPNTSQRINKLRKISTQ